MRSYSKIKPSRKFLNLKYSNALQNTFDRGNKNYGHDQTVPNSLMEQSQFIVIITSRGARDSKNGKKWSKVAEF